MLRFGHPRALVRRVRRLALAAIGTGALLSGCGFVVPEPREPWRAEAEAACMRSGIVKTGVHIRSTKPIDGPGPCGADLPLKVAAFPNDTMPSAYAASTAFPRFDGGRTDLTVTVLKPEATLGCPMVAWLDDWIAGGVQPAAQAWFGQGVVEIQTAGSYACRRRNHQRNARLSEHAFGNAIDVTAFVLQDGSKVTVVRGWRGSANEQGFLRDVLHGACQRFRTVLGPGSDALHYDHFHLDLARHDAGGQRRYCRPKIDPPQRPLSGGWAEQKLPPLTPVMPARPTAASPASGTWPGGESTEIEPNFDPSEFDVTSGLLDLPRRRVPDASSVPAAAAPRARAVPPHRALPYDPAGR